jgi:hypothetical protein
MTDDKCLADRIAAVLATAEEAPDYSPAAALLKFIKERLIEHDYCETIDEAVKFLARKGEFYEGDGWYGAIGVNLVENRDGDRWEEWGYGADLYTTCTLGDLLASAEGHSTLPKWYDDEWIEVSGS